MTIIFHIDVNSAFLSWSAVEELKNGADRDLRKINAIVGGDQKSRHGIVLAKSQDVYKRQLYFSYDDHIQCPAAGRNADSCNE